VRAYVANFGYLFPCLVNDITFSTMSYHLSTQYISSTNLVLVDQLKLSVIQIANSPTVKFSFYTV
jgi:hypothetical protein